MSLFLPLTMIANQIVQEEGLVPYKTGSESLERKILPFPVARDTNGSVDTDVIDLDFNTTSGQYEIGKGIENTIEWRSKRNGISIKFTPGKCRILERETGGESIPVFIHRQFNIGTQPLRVTDIPV